MPARKQARWAYRIPPPRNWRSYFWNGASRTENPQSGAPGETESHARGNRADDRNFARDGDAAVRGDEEASDRTLEWFHAGDSEHGGVARHRESQLGTVVSRQLSAISKTNSAPAEMAGCNVPWKTSIPSHPQHSTRVAARD